MRTARWLLVIMLVPIGACTRGPEAPAADPAAIAAAVDSLNQAFMASVAARDTDAVAGFYTPDARFMAPNLPAAQGQAAVRGMWAGFLATPGLELALDSTQPTVSQAGDLVVDVGTYTMRSTDARGTPTEDIGKYVTVLRKEGGTWKIAVDIFNSDKPAAPAM